MGNNISLSIIIPAYNEEKNIESAVGGVLSVMEKIGSDFEIIVIDDGSRDKTLERAQKLARENKKIRIITNQKNRGLGFVFGEGVEKATREYITSFHGDNDASPEFILNLIKNRGKADIISTYSLDTSGRSYIRRFLSYAFVVVMNLLFGLHMRYYNGTFLCQTKILKKVNPVSRGLTIYAEIKVRLIKKGYTILEAPFLHTGRKFGHSTAVGYANFKQTIEMVLFLIRDIYFYGKP